MRPLSYPLAIRMMDGGEEFPARTKRHKSDMDQKITICPQAAILGVGKIQKRVVVIEASDKNGEVGDTIAIRPMVYLTLTFDHRILDGAIEDYFLGEVVSQLENWS